jgi:hypothetical protein
VVAQTQTGDIARILMGEVLRDARPKTPQPDYIGGYRNLYAATAFGASLIPFDAGINVLASVRAPEGPRTPGIIIASSPHKVGRNETPWQDVFDVDNGYIRYYGDNRRAGVDPDSVRGNRALKHAFDGHQTPIDDDRRRAVPLIFFRRVPREGRQKGYPRFEGFGIARACRRVVQLDAVGEPFVNYEFDFLVMDLSVENEIFDWSWINARRAANCTLEESLSLAPRSWRLWMKSGEDSVSAIRRSVVRRMLVPTVEQQPLLGSRGERILRDVRDYYLGRETRFEAVAGWVTERILAGTGIYRHFGVTRSTGDRGFDFLGRLDLGGGFGTVRLVVLGQAKCEKPNTATSGLDVARTVARLRRGWIGAYVTTGYFSQPIQTEILQDRYPILLVPGLRLAQELEKRMMERGTPDLRNVLAEIEQTHGALTDIAAPDQLLFQ